MHVIQTRLPAARARRLRAPVRRSAGRSAARSPDGLTGALWGGAVRIFLLHHVTWSINSVCHFFGTRRFAVDDHSTNVFWLSLLSFGESWHHNHHAFPRSAVHGLRWWELDPTAWVDPRDAAAAARLERRRDHARAPARRSSRLSSPCSTLHVRAGTCSTCLSAERRQEILDAPRPRRQGRRRAPGRASSACPRTRSGATCASSPPAGSSSACTAARSPPRRSPARSRTARETCTRGEGRARRGRGRRARRRPRRADRRLDDQPRARPPPARRASRARCSPTRRRSPPQLASHPTAAGRADRRDARQAGLGHRRRRTPSTSSAPSAPTRACSASARCTPRPGSEHERPRGGARQARDGRRLGRRDRARDRRQAARRRPVRRRAGRRGRPTSSPRRPRPTRCSTPTAPPACR